MKEAGRDEEDDSEEIGSVRVDYYPREGKCERETNQASSKSIYESAKYSLTETEHISIGETHKIAFCTWNQIKERYREITSN